MKASSVAVFLTVALIVVGGATVVSAQTDWRVLYYPDHAKATNLESGTLEVDRDVFRYLSSRGSMGWIVDLKSVQAIRIEPFRGVRWDVSSIVIESLDKGQIVKHRIALVDDLSLNERAMMTGLMRLRVQQAIDAARSSSR